MIRKVRFICKTDCRKEVKEILETCKGHPNFVLSTGGSTMEGTPDENVQILFEMVKKEE